MAHVLTQIQKPPEVLVAAFKDFGAATVYEAAGRIGSVDPSIKPLGRNMRLLGAALTVRCHPKDNLMLHKALQIAQPGDIIVAGKNWGCGSSREQAVVCLKEIGVGAIVARSFARIYFRNCINQALPIVVCDAVDGVKRGDEITIDFAAGTVTTPGGEYGFPPLAPEVMEILEAGGLIPYARRQLDNA